MIKIPFKIQLEIQLRGISGFSIAWFQDNTLQNPGPHWYILIRIRNTENFLVIMITSQLARRIKYYKNTDKPTAANCLVRVGNNEFPFLHKDKNSAINCNVTEYLSIKEMVHRIDEEQGFKAEKEKVPTYLKREIVSAINKSPLQSKMIKKLAKDSNPI
ncbi:MAG: hypothetical protein ABIF87_12675 [Pseudomonadota bacterium]